MKKVFLVVWLIALILSGCATGSAPYDTESRSEGTGITADLEETIDHEKRYLTHVSDENIICIELPDSKTEGDNLIDTAIVEYATNKLEDICGERVTLSFSDAYVDGSDLAYTGYWIDLKVTSHSFRGLRSIVFDGFLVHRSAAHPTKLFFALNLDSTTSERVWFKDIYQIDSSLYDAFASIAIESIIDEVGEWPKDWGDFETEFCNEEAFVEGIYTETGLSWYQTEAGLYISYPVPFTMGDHREVLIPFEALRTVDELYYLITEENGLFSYTIYDKEKNVVRTEENLTKEPQICMVCDDVISVTEQAGTGIATSSTYYYDVENDRFSSIYQGVFDQCDDLVMYATYDRVIIRDIFNDNGYYQEISEFRSPFSPVAFPFTEAGFVDDISSVRITYLSGTKYEEVTELFEFEWTG